MINLRFILKNFIFIMFFNNLIWGSNYYKIVNLRPQSNNNYIAVYDGGAKTSVLVSGYIDEDTDNTHCVQGINNGQLVTIIIPFNLTTFGIINPACKATASSSSSNPIVPSNCVTDVICGATMTDGGSAVLTNGQSVNIHVSEPCQSLYNYIKNNFANPNSTNYKLSEFAACDGTVSYCAIQVELQSEKNLEIQIDTNITLAVPGFQAGVCTLQSAATPNVTNSSQPPSPSSQCSTNCQAIFQNSGSNVAGGTISNVVNNAYTSVSYSDCSFITNESSGSTVCNFLTQGSLNDWASNYMYNFTNNIQPINVNQAYQPFGIPAGFLKCPYSSSDYQNTLDTLYTESVSNTTNLTQAALQNYFNMQLPTNDRITGSNTTSPSDAENQLLETFYQTFSGSASSPVPGATNKYTIDQYNNAQCCFSNFFSNQANESGQNQAQWGIPCQAAIVADSNGDPVITYTCKTQYYKPTYYCTYIFKVTQAGCSSPSSNNACTFELASTTCNLPGELVIKSPQLGGTTQSCGFCGQAEAYTVGQNQVGVKIESNMPDLAPFYTAQSPSPVCSTGFISYLGAQ